MSYDEKGRFWLEKRDGIFVGRGCCYKPPPDEEPPEPSTPMWQTVEEDTDELSSKSDS